MSPITTGHILRHAPPSGNADLGVAVLDIAQDFLLRHLAEQDIFELVALKGGTSIRKLYAGTAGRFSTDIDLAMLESRPAEQVADHKEAIAELIVEHSAAVAGPFSYRAHQRRGRWHLTVTSEFGNPSQSIKIDVGPPPWLRTEGREFVAAAIQNEYGFALPALKTVTLVETLAEKIARLNRPDVSTARDAYDLVWAASTPPFSTEIARQVLRRLAILKMWGDVNGIGTTWPALRREPFDPKRWLRRRDDWDDESIGVLATPAPSLEDLGTKLRERYSWLGETSDEEARWARCDPRDREGVIEAIATLPGASLSETQLRRH